MFDLGDMAAKAVKSKVEDAAAGKVSDLEVIVEGTEVTVRGQVATEEDKKAVLAAVQNVEGISKIVTGLTIKTEEDAKTVASNTYTVQAGDTLWAIAQNKLGNGALYTKIYEANKAVIGSNPDLIKVGMELVIPQ